MARGRYERHERLTPQAIDEVWVRLRAGMAAKPAARELGLGTSTVRDYLHRCGGIRPDPRRRAVGRFSLVEREETSRGLAAGHSLRVIAAGLGRAPSTVCREVAANGGVSADRLLLAVDHTYAEQLQVVLRNRTQGS